MCLVPTPNLSKSVIGLRWVFSVLISTIEFLLSLNSLSSTEHSVTAKNGRKWEVWGQGGTDTFLASSESSVLPGISWPSHTESKPFSSIQEGERDFGCSTQKTPEWIQMPGRNGDSFPLMVDPSWELLCHVTPKKAAGIAPSCCLPSGSD